MEDAYSEVIGTISADQHTGVFHAEEYTNDIVIFQAEVSWARMTTKAQSKSVTSESRQRITSSRGWSSPARVGDGPEG